MLVPELIKLGHKVTVIDNLMFKQTSLNQLCQYENFDFINGDIRDEKLMAREIAKADILVPLAALVGAPICNKDPFAAETVNLKAPMSMFKMASKQQAILMPITNSAYGKGGPDGACDENSPLHPISLYAIHKVEVEKELMERENSISFRLATVFGMSPRMRLDLLVNDFVYRGVNDRFIVLFEAHFRRNYIHVMDVVNVFLQGMNKFDSMKGQIYNVGLSEANLTKMELAMRIKEHIPQFTIMEAPIGEDPDKRDYLVSNAKIEKTGWKPQHGLDAGIRELIKGFRMMKNSSYANV
jgi:nucleoside-diphosphate-sugar epimerase